MKRLMVTMVSAVLVAGLAGAVWPEDEAAGKIDEAAQAKIRKLISDGGYYYALGNFKQALASAEAALRIDPKNVAARQLKEMSEQAIKEREEQNPVLAQRRDFHEQIQEVNIKMAGQRELLREGENWPMVKQRTGGVYGPAARVEQDNREINKRLDETVVSAEFEKQPLREVVRFLATMSTLNIQIDPRAAVEGKPAAEVEVTFQARNMKLRNVIAWVTRLTNLCYTVRDEVVLITDKEHLDEFKVTAVYDISDITAPIPDSASVPEFDFTLPSINARRIGYGFYTVPFNWNWQTMGPFTGAYFLDFAQHDRYFMTEQEVKRLVDALIEGEEGEQ